MRRPRYEIEAEIPRRGSGSDSQKQTPKVRRQMERICEALEIEYDDLVEFHLVDGRAAVILFDRNDDGELYRNEFGKVATIQFTAEVDTSTFVGDERDI